MIENKIDNYLNEGIDVKSVIVRTENALEDTSRLLFKLTGFLGALSGLLERETDYKNAKVLSDKWQNNLGKIVDIIEELDKDITDLKKEIK